MRRPVVIVSRQVRLEARPSPPNSGGLLTSRFPPSTGHELTRKPGTMIQAGALKRSLLVAALVAMVATPAMAEWRLPCINGGCSMIFVSPEDAARPVQPLNPAAALAAVNAFRTKNGRGTVVLDARLTKAAAMQSETQAKRS